MKINRMHRSAMLSAAATGLAAVCGLAWPQGDIQVNRISLMVLDGASAKPTAGLLFRVFPDRREHVADISESGKPSKPVKCKSEDKFEAQAESKLDRPLAPTTLTCSRKLAFSFTRMFVTVFPPDMANPLAAEEAVPKVFASYADVFAGAGKPAAAKAWMDAAKLATAMKLGDVKTDKYLYRDPMNGSELVFTPSGVAALKAKQKEFGLMQTGMMDPETLDAFVKQEKPAKDVDALICKPKNGHFVCELVGDRPIKQTPGLIVLPKFEFKR